MLAKKSRLTAIEVRAILRTGRSARSETLSVKYTKGASAKAAVVVKTAVAKSAVKRNALRRAAYDTLKGCLPKATHAVFFLHKPQLDTKELTLLCSKLS